VASYKELREVVFLAELPLSGAGKVLRREIKGK
jgi:acyl-CoA synthetase (AMP-forming)/AMP-acid ligase II